LPESGRRLGAVEEDGLLGRDGVQISEAEFCGVEADGVVEGWEAGVAGFDEDDIGALFRFFVIRFFVSFMPILHMQHNTFSWKCSRKQIKGRLLTAKSDAP